MESCDVSSAKSDAFRNKEGLSRTLEVVSFMTAFRRGESITVVGWHNAKLLRASSAVECISMSTGRSTYHNSPPKAFASGMHSTNVDSNAFKSMPEQSTRSTRISLAI